MWPKEWHCKKISEIFEKVSIPVKVEQNQLYREIGIRSHGKGIFYKNAVTGKSLGNKRVFHIEPDCFIVNIVFAWELAIAKTTKNEIGMIASHRFPMYRPIKKHCNLDYVLYLFKSKLGKYLLELASPGGAGRNKTLGQNEFARIELNLPPIKEQDKIVQILSTWDEAIITTKKLLVNTQEKKKAVMQQLLKGKKRFPGFKDKWTNKHLSEISEIIVSPVDKKTLQGEIPVKLCNYTDVYYNMYITNQMKFMKASATKAEIQKYNLKLGDVIITKDSETPGDIAISALVTQELNGVVCGYHLAIIRPDNHLVDGAFLNYLFSMQTTRYYFFTLATGVTRFGLSVGSIARAKFLLPSLREQKKIVSILSIIDREISLLNQKLDFLNQEKKALIQQLLTGKKRVNI